MTEKDAEQLRLLSIGHYFVAALQALAGCFPIIHFVLGAAMVFAPEKFGPAKDGPTPALIGGAVMVFAGSWMLMSWVLAACLVFVSRSLVRRKRYLFCLTTDALAAMLCMPLGTLIGVLTIIVLVRPTVKAAFESAGAGMVEQPPGP